MKALFLLKDVYFSAGLLKQKVECLHLSAWAAEGFVWAPDLYGQVGKTFPLGFVSWDFSFVSKIVTKILKSYPLSSAMTNKCWTHAYFLLVKFIFLYDHSPKSCCYTNIQEGICCKWVVWKCESGLTTASREKAHFCTVRNGFLFAELQYNQMLLSSWSEINWLSCYSCGMGSALHPSDGQQSNRMRYWQV